MDIIERLDQICHQPKFRRLINVIILCKINQFCIVLLGQNLELTKKRLMVANAGQRNQNKIFGRKISFKQLLILRRAAVQQHPDFHPKRSQRMAKRTKASICKAVLVVAERQTQRRFGNFGINPVCNSEVVFSRYRRDKLAPKRSLREGRNLDLPSRIIVPTSDWEWTHLLSQRSPASYNLAHWLTTRSKTFDIPLLQLSQLSRVSNIFLLESANL